MKKILTGFLCAFLIFLFACSGEHEFKSEKTAVTQTTIQEKNTTMVYEALINLLDYDRSKNATFIEEKSASSEVNAQGVNISFIYPQLSNMDSQTQQQKVNQLIHEFALDKAGYNQEFFNDLDHFDMTYRITLSTPEIISILFEGNMAGAEGMPGSFAHGLTFDVNTFQIFTLSDFVELNDNLAKNIFVSERVFNRSGHSEDTLRQALHADLEYFLADNSTDWEEYFKWSQFYLTPSALNIQFNVGRAAGGYVWVEVPM